MARNLRNTSGSVIVAVDEPEPLEEMLRMATLLSAGVQARVIALTVSLGSVEHQEEAIGAIEQIVARLAKQGTQVSTMVVSATSVARGVLDVARENGADLILLGLSRDPAQRSGVGTIAENIAATSPCPVVIYRPGKTDISQVLIACDVSDLSEAALRVGARLAEHLARPLSMVTVGEMLDKRAMRRHLRRRLYDLGLSPDLPHKHLDERDPARAIFQQADEQTLLVTGYDYAPPDQDDWFYSRLATALLRGADGAVVLVIRDRGEHSVTRQASLLVRVLRWLHPTVTPVEQRDLLGRADQMSRTSLDYNVLVLIAAVLASLGLLANSNAVIIGAMLVAPLMSPLIGFAAAIAVGRMDIMQRALITLLEGFLVALAVAWLIGMLNPAVIVTSEMAARGNPTLLDLGVALAAGVIAAYAQARKDIPAALAGVAIAAALMPPICTVGLAFAMDEMPLFQGALMLFFTNISAIMFAAGTTFLYLGLRPRVPRATTTRRAGSLIGIALFGITMALMISFVVNPISNIRIERELRAAFPGSELIELELRRSEPLRVIATVRREAGLALDQPEVERARADLEQSLGRAVTLEVVVQEVVRSAP